MGLNLPVIKPGYRGRGVPYLKALLRENMTDPASRKLLAKMSHDQHYGPVAAQAVRAFQRKHNLAVDGIVARRTWLALGVHDADLSKPSNQRPANEPASLMGIPWVPGVTDIDGRWVPVGHAKIIRHLRASGEWSGRLFSGWRPDWYQAQLFAAALARYGSYSAASRMVAPPGRSHHRFMDNRGAIDVTYAYQISAHSDFRQVMSWEPWHLERRGVRALAARLMVNAPAIDDSDTLNEEIDMDAVMRGVDEHLLAMEAAIENNGSVADTD
jgi:hypothetical protein